MLNDAPLSPVQRGLVWEVWRTQRGGVVYHAFRGVRAVDDTALLLLEGLTLHDGAGELVEDPRTAGRTFLLSAEDTRQFLLRVKGAGGQVHRAELTPQAALDAAERAERASAELDGLLAHDRATIVEVRARDFSGLPAFERRDARIREQFAAARVAFEDCERATQDGTQPGITVDERSAAEGVLGRARVALQRAGALLEEREAAEGEIARWHAYANGNGPDPKVTPATQALLFREVGRVLAEQGMEVQPTEEGVRVRTPVGWVALGPSLTVESLARS